MFVFAVAQEYLKGLEENWVIIDDEHAQRLWELIVHRCVLLPLYLVTFSYFLMVYLLHTNLDRQTKIRIHKENTQNPM
jgi:hypothetical protein